MPEEKNEKSQSDLEQVQAFIKAETEKYFKEISQQKPAVEEKQNLSEQELAKQQLKEFINPFVEPDINSAKLAAADAKDEVRFYRKNPEALEYEDKIEEAFQKLVSAGRPTSRQDIYDYIVGQTYRQDKNKFVENALAKRKAQTERAESAMDFGTGSIDRARNDSTFGEGVFSKLPVEDMEKALEGITF